MHTVVIKHVLNILKLDPPPFSNWEKPIQYALCDTDILGPISLAKALQKCLPAGWVDKELINKINKAIKEVEAEDSSFSLDISLIMSQTNASYDVARAYLLKNNGDVVNSIIDLTEPVVQRVVYGENLPGSPFDKDSDSDSDDELLPELEDTFSSDNDHSSISERRELLQGKEYNPQVLRGRTSLGNPEAHLGPTSLGNPEVHPGPDAGNFLHNYRKKHSFSMALVSKVNLAS